MFYGNHWDKMPVQAKIKAVWAELQKDIDRWEDIKQNGCNDPFWPDGVNLNLVRNHIIHDLRLLSDLEQKPVQISMFMLLDGAETVPDDVMNDERIPPIVPDTFMAHDRRCNYFRNSVASGGK